VIRLGCSLSLLLLLLVCVAAGDDFQPGLLFCLSRPAGPLQIACDVGLLGLVLVTRIVVLMLPVFGTFPL